MATSKDKPRWNRDARLGAPKESMGTSLVRQLFKMPAPTTARPANTAPLQSKQTKPLLLVGLLVSFAHHTYMTKKQPYLDDLDDLLSQMSGIQIFLTLLIGLTLKVKVKSDPRAVEIILMGMTVLIMVFGLFAILTAFQKPKWLGTCMEKLYGKASRNMMLLF